MKKIKVITAFPYNKDLILRKIEDLYPHQKSDPEISLSYNSPGSIHGQSDVNHEFALA